MEDTTLDITEPLGSQGKTFESELLSQLSSLEDKRWASQPYNRSVAQIDWEQVAFGSHSADQCKAQWELILGRLRITRTLPELLADARASRWDLARERKANKRRQRSEGAPTKPPNQFALFLQEIRPKLIKKNPGLSQSELMKMGGVRYKAISEKKKERLRAEHEAAMEDYREKMAAFREDHPELEVSRPPPKPESAAAFYRRKHPDLTAKQARDALAALPLQARSKYLRKALRAQQRYEKAVEAYQEQYPDWKPPTSHKTAITKAEQRALDEVDGKLRPPRRAFDIFRAEKSSAGMKNVSQLWKELDSASREMYRQISDQERQRYQAYLATLPEELQQKLRPKRLRPKKLTALDVYLEQMLPKSFEGGISESDWRLVLRKKYRRLHESEKREFQAKADEANQATAEPVKPQPSSLERKVALNTDAQPVLTNGTDWQEDASHDESDSAPPAHSFKETAAEEPESADESPRPITPKVKKRKRAAVEEPECASTPVATAQATQEPPPRTPLEMFTASYLRQQETEEPEKKQRKIAKKLWKRLEPEAREKVEASFHSKYGSHA